MTMRSAVAAFALICASPALAEDAGPDRIVEALSFADLKAVVAALGHKIEAEDPDSQTLRAADANGTHYLLTGTACDIEGVPGCRGVVMQALYTADETLTPERLAQANLDQVAVSTRYYPDRRVVAVTRYVVLDGGVTMANVGQNVAVLLTLAPEVLAIVLAR